MHRVLTSKCQRVIQRHEYHAQNQIIRAIRNALRCNVNSASQRSSVVQKCSTRKEIVLSYGPSFGHYLHIHTYILVLDIRYILGIFTNAYFGDRTGLSLLKFLLEALCSASSRHQYRKTNTDIQRSIFSLPRFPLSFPSCVASFLLRQRK